MVCRPPISSVHGIFQEKNTGEGCHFLLQGIFLTKAPNSDLLHQQADYLPLSHLGSPVERLLCVKRYWTSCFHLFITNLLNTYLAHPWWLRGLKCLSAMRETCVRPLGWEDPLKKKIATHSSILAWKIPWTEKPGGLQSMGSQRVGHDWATSLLFT